MFYEAWARGWRQSAIILLASLMVAVAMFVVSFTFPTLESGYLTVTLVTLLLATLARHLWGASLGRDSSGVLLIIGLFATLLAVICMFDAMNWSLLGDKRDGETGLAVGLIISFYLSLRQLRRLFPKVADRADILLTLLLIAAAVTISGFRTVPVDPVPGLETLCAGILVLMILPEVWRISSQLPPGRRLALNMGGAYTVINSLSTIYPERLSGKFWVWLLLVMACIASRRGEERQSPAVAIVDRMLLGTGLFLSLLDGLTLLPETALNMVIVPASMMASLILLSLLGRLKGNCPTLLCWTALIMAGFGVLLSSAMVDHLPHPSKLLVKYLLPLILLTIGIRHHWLRYRSGIRPLFISGTKGFPSLSMGSVLRAFCTASPLLFLIPAFLLPCWILVSNTSPTRLLAGLYGTRLWPGVPLYVTLAMHDEYYYYDKVPWRWPTSGDPNAVIENLWHNPPDKFSYYNPVSLQEEFDRYRPVKGKKADARLNFIYRKDKKTGALRIAGIYPQSPLEKAGLHRGDELLAINHKPVKLGRVCREVGEQVALTVRNTSGEERSVHVTCAAAAPFKPFHRIISTASGPVGYLFLYGFNLNEYIGIESAVRALHESGIRKLVLDLRYNGGGMVMNEKDLDARLLEKGFQGIGLSRDLHNRKYRDLDSSDTVPAASISLGLSHLVVLTSEETCSASESLINNLGQYLRVWTVGSRTCGKPMEMEVKTLGENGKGARLELVTALMENAKGEGGYFNGIPPDCPATDDGRYDLGDQREKVFQEALHLLETGRCSQENQAMKSPVGGD